jgi:hypothetical protein
MTETPKKEPWMYQIDQLAKAYIFGDGEEIYG